MGKTRTQAVLSVAILLACCPCAFGLDPSLDVSQYAHTAWKIREGFAAGAIHQVVQTPDGYLWLATEAGLLRFDGVRTVPWQPPPGERLPSDDIRGVMVARDGTLWLGTAKGLVSVKDRKLVHYPELDGHDVYALLEDHEGTVWAGGVVWEGAYSQPGKLCAIKAGITECYGSDGSFGFGVTAIHEDKRGNLWLAAGNGVWRWKPGPPQKYVPPLRMYGIPSFIFGINALVDEEPDGLIVASANGITHLVSGRLEPYSFLPFEQQRQPTLLRDREGSLWIGTLNAGLVHLHHGRLDVFTQADGLSGAPISSLFEDREGSIWVATAAGLDRFREYAIPTIGKKQGLSNSNMTCLIAARDGSVWLGLTDALNRWDRGQVTVYRKPSRLPETGAARPGGDEEIRGPSGTSRLGPMVQEVIEPELPGYLINALYQDRRGRIWIATSSGVAYFEDGGIHRLADFKLTDLNAMVGDSMGNLWIAASEQGLARLRDGRLVEQIPWNKLGIQGALSNPLAADTVNGGVWVASWSGGVLWFRDGQVRASFGAKEGLGSGRVNSLQPDHEGAIWAATDGGLSRIKDGHVTTLTSSNGLPCDTVHDLIEDDAGSFWVRSACGLLRIARAELDAWVANPKLRIQTSVFDVSDGVQSYAGAFAPLPRVAKTRDGRLWFLLSEGVSVVDPNHLVANTLPPPVHIEQVVADGKTYDPSSGLRLPPRVRNLAIDYTASSFVAPEKVRFRYKLEGQDKDWREVVNDRKVQYSNLLPKHYRFRVMAANNSGVWNDEGAALDFVIPPMWYQTNWFRLACLAAFALLLWALYRLRVRQLAHQFNLTLDARVAERTRIARDLHDTLLQSFQAVLPLFQVAIYKLPEGAVDARKTLEVALDRASEAIGEGRDAVKGLRLSTVEKNDLAMTIRTFGGELASADHNQSSPEFNVVVEGTSRNLHPILRDEVYRLAAEALRNAFRHAAAHSIEVEIRYDEKHFRLRVRDDGKGIGDEVLRTEGRHGHYGLPGMKERAELVGGKLTIWSEVDNGTEIELVIPASRAYAQPTRRLWKFGKRSPEHVDVTDSINRE
jgi:signal transduction histidine kinase